MERLYHYVYRIDNLINGKYYIGKHSATSLDNDYMGSGDAIKAAIEKYKLRNFKKTILKTFPTSQEAYDYEAEVVTMKEVKDPAFAGGAITLWDRLSLGAQYILYFGKIEKNVNLAFGKDSYRNIVSGHKLQLNASTAKFGLQYDQPLGGMTKMTIGGTYKLKAGMHGYTNDYSYATISSLTDTLKNNTVHLTGKEKLKFSDELGVGISLKGGERWSAEVDYIRSDWRNLGYDETSGFSNSSAYVFSSSVAQSFRAGFEFTPNRSDIRYFYKRITYRGGLYYDQSYYRLDGNPIDSYGITLGATIPVNAGYNGITVGLEFGKKGTIKNGLVRENYFGFNIGFNIFDIWFQKSMYD